MAAEAESDPALVYTHHGLTHMTNGFVRYPNGAVVPQDTASVQAAKGLHLSAKALVHPYHLLPKILPKAVVPTTDVDQVIDFTSFVFLNFHIDFTSFFFTG